MVKIDLNELLNKALHLTFVKVAEIHNYNQVFRTVE